MNKKDNYIKLNEEQLKKLHDDLLFILIEIDRICRKNNIKYFLSDGTLLGAIRHKGFIPWDDDIDIHMLRSDYNKFCNICKQELDEKFLLQTQETDENYNWVYGKVRLKDTVYVRAGQEHLKQITGVFVDVFPIDNIIENKFIQSFFSLICKICRKILWSPVGAKNCNFMIEICLYKLLSLIPRKFSINIFNIFTRFFNNKETRLVTSNNVQYGKNKRYILKKEWYENNIEVEFEKHKFLAPIGYKKILSCTYGDYMKLPPKNERHGHCYASYIKFSDGTELRSNM